MTRTRVINTYGAIYVGHSHYFKYGDSVLVYEKVTTMDAPLKGKGAPKERTASVEVMIGGRDTTGTCETPWYVIPRMSDLDEIEYWSSRGEALDYD